MYKYEPKAFCCCECEWEIGISYREKGSRITQLKILRQARNPAEQEGAVSQIQNQRLMFVGVQANDLKIVCGHCGALTGWFANQNAIEVMLERKSKRAREVVVNG
jgi:hypothetical protein